MDESTLFDEFDFRPIKVLVDEEVRELDYDIPIFFDLETIDELLRQDLTPVDSGNLATLDDAGGSGDVRSSDECNLGGNPDDGVDRDLVDSLAGEMTRDDFETWCARFVDLYEVAIVEDRLERCGLDYYEALDSLDENIDAALRNANLVRNRSKAAFRMAREACGASQAVLAEALGVGARTVKRWEAPDGPEVPEDAWGLVESWVADAREGAQEHLVEAVKLRDECFPPFAYRLVIWRSQEEFDRALAPILANAPAHGWRERLEDARNGEEPEVPYTDRPGTRGYWRANAAARMAATLMDAEGVGYGFCFAGEEGLLEPGLHVWVPRVDVEVVPRATGERPFIVCGMR